MEREMEIWMLWGVIESMDIGTLGGTSMWEWWQPFAMEIRFVSWLGSGDEKGLFYITLWQVINLHFISLVYVFIIKIKTSMIYNGWNSF